MKTDLVSEITKTQPVQQIKKTEEVKVKKEEKPEKVKEEAVHKREEITIDQEKLKKLVEHLKESVPNAEPKFGVHEETNRVMVKLVDKDTQKVIREFPLEKTLDSLAKTLDIAGAMVDEKL